MIHKTFTSFKRGFTMLELIFVIVILGIVASIGSSLIAQVYESYIVQRALHRTSMKAELAAMQIANRLTYRISSSVIGRKLPTGTPANKYLPLDQVPDESYKILEWISYDNDSFSAQSQPGWSGFCDVESNETNRTTISTPGSNLVGSTSTIIGNLGGAISDAAIIFAGHEYSPTKNYIANCMGFEDHLGGSDSTCISPVSSVDGNITIRVTDNNAKVMTDQYKLVWSAYAIVPTQITDPELTKRGFESTDEIYDIALHYNYQPWNGDTYSENNSTLVTNVESFRFVGKGDTIRFKICVVESIGNTIIRSCKEKAVIR